MGVFVLYMRPVRPHKQKRMSPIYHTISERYSRVKPYYIAGIHYAVRIFIGASIAWLLMGSINEINRLWAVISLVAVTDPDMKTAWTTFKSRAISTVIGCGVGLGFIAIFGMESWLMPFAVTLTAIISIYVLRMQLGWRIGPITAAIVVSGGLMGKANTDVMNVAFSRAFAVFVGSIVALIVTWALSRIWMPRSVVPPVPKAPNQDY
jgi:uncharacterized membrane protein YccC